MPELNIEGVVGQWADVSSASVRDQLAGKSGDLTVYVNSIGGDVFDGPSIYNQLRRYDGKVTVIVDGIAASIASAIAMAGDEVVMGVGSEMMIHAPWTVTVGNAAEHEKAVTALGKVFDSLLSVYAARIEDVEQLTEWVQAETWFNATEAVDAGFADRVDADVEMAAVMVPSGLYMHTPIQIVAKDAQAIQQKVWNAVTMGMRAEIAKRK